MPNYAYFIKVDSGANNNKFYEMTVRDGQLVCRFGRVGTNGQTKVYPAGDWHKVVSDRIAHGYVERTEMRSASGPAVAFKALAGAVADLVAFLRKQAGESVARNYVAGDAATPAMIDQAQRILDNIAAMNGSATIWSINSQLQGLWTVLPRKMRNVADELLPRNATKAEVAAKINAEQALLDQVRAQVATAAKPADASKTLLEAVGIEVREATQAEKDQVFALVEPGCKRRVHRVFKVTNTRTQAAFDKIAGPTKLYFHGSKTANWWSILTNGLVVRPAAAYGRSLGNGLYFADQFQKSAGYTDVVGSYWAKGNSQVGYMAVYAVKPGRVKRVSGLGDYHNDARNGDCDSVHAPSRAQGGPFINPEYVIFDAARCTVAYLLEIVP